MADQHADPLTNDIGAELFEQVFRRAVEQKDLSFGIGDDDRVNRGFKTGAQVGIQPCDHLAAQHRLTIEVQRNRQKPQDQHQRQRPGGQELFQHPFALDPQHLRLTLRGQHRIDHDEADIRHDTGQKIGDLAKCLTVARLQPVDKRGQHVQIVADDLQAGGKFVWLQHAALQVGGMGGDGLDPAVVDVEFQAKIGKWGALCLGAIQEVLNGQQDMLMFHLKLGHHPGGVFSHPEPQVPRGVKDAEGEGCHGDQAKSDHQREKERNRPGRRLSRRPGGGWVCVHRV